MNTIIILSITLGSEKKLYILVIIILIVVNLNDVLDTRYSDASLPRNCFHQAPRRGLHLWSGSHIHISTYTNENDQIIDKSKDKKHRNYILYI